MKTQQNLRFKSRVLIFLLVLVSYFWPAIIFYPTGRLLSRNDHPEKAADFVVVLMGQVDIRPSVAAKAVLAGFAEKLVFVASESNSVEMLKLVPSETELAKAVITKNGLDSSRMIVVENFGRASSTIEEALILNKFFRSLPKPPKRLVVVTSWPHSSRAGWILEKALSPIGVDVEMMPVEKAPFEVTNWWTSEYGLLFVFEEYVKWGRYLIKFAGRDITKEA